MLWPSSTLDVSTAFSLHWLAIASTAWPDVTDLVGRDAGVATRFARGTDSAALDSRRGLFQSRGGPWTGTINEDDGLEKGLMRLRCRIGKYRHRGEQK